MANSWSVDRIPGQSGRSALVTGANSGIGFWTAVGLARAGARVLMGCRDATRGADALARVEKEVPGATAELVSLDLASLDSIRAAAEDVAGRVGTLDVLIANAGVMALPRWETADGFEMQFGTNHLGHFALVGRLLPQLLASPAPRVVAVASGAHKIGRINFDDLMGEQSYGRWRAYGQSKLANLLFVCELDRRARATATSLVAAAAHPGYAATNLQGAAPKMEGNRAKGMIMALGNRVFAQSDTDGAMPSLYAATMPDVSGGDYYGPGGLGEMRGAPKKVKPTAAARNDDTARRLWEVSEKLTGVSYDALDAHV